MKKKEKTQTLNTRSLEENMGLAVNVNTESRYWDMVTRGMFCKNNLFQTYFGFSLMTNIPNLPQQYLLM